jgi:hypothetical protein
MRPQLPGDVERPEEGVEGAVLAGEDELLSALSPALVAELREERSARDTDERTRLLDRLHGGREVVVVLQRVLDEALEGRVAEDLPPGQVGERRGFRGSDLSPVGLGHLDVGTPVVGSDRTARRREGDREERRRAEARAHRRARARCGPAGPARTSAHPESAHD